MEIKNTYSELYLQRRDLDKRIKNAQNSIRMYKQLKSQINTQIRQHLTQKSMQTITNRNDTNNRTITNHYHQDTRINITEKI